jgi:hypothetical protein
MIRIFFYSTLLLSCSLTFVHANLIVGASYEDTDGIHMASSHTMNRDTTLRSFRGDNGLQYASFVLANTVGNLSLSNGSISPYWGQNGTALTDGDDALAATDGRLDTGIINLSSGEFLFPSSPTSLDQVFFIFEIGVLNEGDRSLQLIDGLGGSIVGAPVTINLSSDPIGTINFTRVNGAGTASESSELLGRYAEFGPGGFGLNAGQLSSVAGVRINGGDTLDPALVGFAQVPEPSSGLLLLIGLVVARALSPRMAGRFGVR